MLARSKLISILRTLQPRELRRFEEYVHSPFFNKNENVKLLFDSLAQYSASGYIEEELDWERSFRHVFPDIRPEEQRLRYVMTDLTKLLEDFVGYLEFERADLYRRHKTLMALDNRKLGKYFQQTFEGLLEMNQKQPFRDVDYFFQQHLLYEDAYLHLLHEDNRGIKDTLQLAIDNLDYYYLSNKLRFCCVMFNRENILQVKYENSLTEQVIEFVKQRKLEDVPAIAIYFNILSTLRFPEDESYYQKLKEMLTEHIGLFPKTEAKDMYVFALNYCIKKLNSGRLEFLDELFELYMALLDKSIIIDNGLMEASDYKNIATVGMRTGNLDWTERFIEEYSQKLPEDVRENIHTYNLAFLSYYRGQFSQSLKLLQQVDFEDVYYQMDAKVLLLKTYYELQEEEPFFSLVDAFHNFIKRNRTISEYQKTAYLNFVKYAKKLMHIRLGNKVSLIHVLEELDSSMTIASLQWLKEKSVLLQSR